jgi:hypothetical protein
MIVMYACNECLSCIPLEAADSGVCCVCNTPLVVSKLVPVRDIYAGYKNSIEGKYEIVTPLCKVGDDLNYQVGDTYITGKLVKILLRNNPYIGAEYLYRIQIKESNDPSWGPGSFLVDDEIYFL